MTITTDREKFADQAFAKSTILEHTERTLLLGREGSSTMITEFILGRWGTLVIHGDGPDMMLCGRSPFGCVEAAIRWVASAWKHKDYRYIASKVIAGERREFSVEAARAELAAQLEEDVNEYNEFAEDEENPRLPLETIGNRPAHTYDDEDPRAPFVAFPEFIDDLDECTTQEGLYAGLGQIFDGDSMCGFYEADVGSIPAQPLVYAIAACARVVECLDENKEEE